MRNSNEHLMTHDVAGQRNLSRSFFVYTRGIPLLVIVRLFRSGFNVVHSRLSIHQLTPDPYQLPGSKKRT